MFGKPGKLQLEYEWQPIAVPFNNQENGQAQLKPLRTQHVLRCLLKLVATEVNPKPLVGIRCYLLLYGCRLPDIYLTQDAKNPSKCHDYL